MANHHAALIAGIDVGTKRSAYAILRLHVNGHGSCIELVESGQFETYDTVQLRRLARAWKAKGIRHVGIERPIPAPRIGRSVLINLSVSAGFLEGYMQARGFVCDLVTVTEVRKLIGSKKRGTPGDAAVKRFLLEHVKGMKKQRTSVHERDAAMVAYMLLKRYF